MDNPDLLAKTLEYVMYRFRHVSVALCTLLGAFALGAGSIIIGVTVLDTTSSPEAAGYAVFYVWPLTMLLFCLFGVGSLIAAHRNRVGYWMMTCLVLWGLLFVATIMLGIVQAPASQRVSILIVPMLLATDGYALNLGRRLIFPPASTIPNAN